MHEWTEKVNTDFKFEEMDLLVTVTFGPSGSVGSASDSYSVGPWIEARLV